MEDHTLFVPFERGPFEDRLSMTVPTEGCNRIRIELALLEGAVDLSIVASDDEVHWSCVGQRHMLEGPGCCLLGAQAISASFVRVELRAQGDRAVVTGGGLRLERG
jgi:hypothetical protein